MTSRHDGAMTAATEHDYRLTVEWTGDRGTGTSGYRDYHRSITVSADGRPDLLASADRTFHGDASRWNPEEMLVAALSTCHLLSYLHIAAREGIVVTGYADEATGTMVQAGIGGHFTEVVLRPVVTVTDPAMVEAATKAHRAASEACFIAASVNFPVRHEPRIEVAR